MIVEDVVGVKGIERRADGVTCDIREIVRALDIGRGCGEYDMDAGNVYGHSAFMQAMGLTVTAAWRGAPSRLARWAAGV